MAVEHGCSNILPRTQQVAASSSNAFILCDRVTVIFNLLISKQVHGFSAWWVLPCMYTVQFLLHYLLRPCYSHHHILPILGFLDISVLELGRGTRQTDGWTDRQTDEQTNTGHHFIMAPPCGGRWHNNANKSYLKYVPEWRIHMMNKEFACVCRLFSSRLTASLKSLSIAQGQQKKWQCPQ